MNRAFCIGCNNAPGNLPHPGGSPLGVSESLAFTDKPQTPLRGTGSWFDGQWGKDEEDGDSASLPCLQYSLENLGIYCIEYQSITTCRSQLEQYMNSLCYGSST